MKTLKNFARGSHYLHQIFEAGGLHAIRHAMQIHRYDVKIQEQGAITISKFTFLTEYLQQCNNNVCITALVLGMASHPAERGCVNESIKTLGTLCPRAMGGF